MPCGAIIHEENSHKCMTLYNMATLNSANFHRERFHESSSIHKIRIFPSVYTVSQNTEPFSFRTCQQLHPILDYQTENLKIQPTQTTMHI